MTVSSELNRKEYAGNGVTTAFATSPVIFFDASDLEVYDVLDSTGVATLKTITTHYTVSGGAGSTGTVTMLTAPASGHTLVIVRSLPLTQADDFVQNDASDAEVLEDALDRQTMVSQQLQARVDRSIRLPDGDVSGADTELPTPTALTVPGWNAAGTGMTNYPVQTGTSLVDLAASTGSSLVGHIASGTGAVARTVQAKLRDAVSVLDFIPTALHAGIVARTNATDLTAYIQAAIDAIGADGGLLYFPAGKYLIKSGLLPLAFQTLEGPRSTVTTDGAVIFCDNSDVDMLHFTAGDWMVRGLVLQHNADTAPGTGSIVVLGTATSALTSGGLIEDCRLYSAPQAAIDMRHAGDTIIRGNGFESNVIGIRATNGSGTTANDIRVKDNIFYSNSYDLDAAYGVRWQIEANLFQLTTNQPIIFTSSGGQAIISGNIFDRVGGPVKLAGTGLNKIDDNIFLSGLNYGIHLSGTVNYNTVSGNILYNGSQTSTNTTDAIILDTNADHNRIVNNIVLSGYRYGVNVSAAGVTNTVIKDNGLHSLGTNAINNSGTGTIIRNNEGYVTENSGSSSITSGSTSVVVTHGLNVTPAAQDISITFKEQGTSDYGRWWVDTITSTQFTLNVSADPGASNLDFGWRAVVL